MPRFWAIALVLLFVGCDIPGEPGDGYWDNEPAIFTFSFTNRLGTFAATATQTLVDSTNVSEASRKQARDTLEKLQDSLKRAGRWESAEAVRRSRANAELAAEILVGLAVNARLFSAARELSMAVLESEAGSSGHCPKKTVVLGGQCRSKDFGFVLSPLCCASKDECSAGALDLGFSVVDPPDDALWDAERDAREGTRAAKEPALLQLSIHNIQLGVVETHELRESNMVVGCLGKNDTPLPFACCKPGIHLAFGSIGRPAPFRPSPAGKLCLSSSGKAKDAVSDAFCSSFIAPGMCTKGVNVSGSCSCDVRTCIAQKNCCENALFPSVADSEE